MKIWKSIQSCHFGSLDIHKSPLGKKVTLSAITFSELTPKIIFLGIPVYFFSILTDSPARGFGPLFVLGKNKSITRFLPINFLDKDYIQATSFPKYLFSVYKKLLSFMAIIKTIRKYFNFEIIRKRHNLKNKLYTT